MGKEATKEETTAYINTLSPVELFNLNMDIFVKDINPFSLDDLSDDGDDNCLDDEEGLDGLLCENDDIFDGSGQLECMPVRELKKYTIRIKLRGISPSIWRKIEVPSSVKLTSLAEIIIDAMGWCNAHLHQFVTKGRSNIYRTARKADNGFFLSNSVWGGDYSISHLLVHPKDKVLFEYDYGDGWEHDVVLSKVADYAEGEKPRVHFLGGKRACPPEDCGGVFGYYDLCEAVSHPYSARAREMEEWLGYKFDPEIFDKEETKYSVEGYNVE